MVVVLGRRDKAFEPCAIGSGARGNFVECGERLLYFRCCKNADGLESLCPGAIDGDFIRQETAVECKGTLERIELIIGLTLEPPSPQPAVLAFSHSVLMLQSYCLSPLCRRPE